MAISARVAPELIVHGVVAGSRQYLWDGEDRGQKVTVETNGGGVVVGFRKEERDQIAPIGTEVTLVVSVFDGQNGASLSFVRALTPADADAILGVFAGSK